MAEIVLPNRWAPRDYQRPLMEYLDQGGLRAVCVWHRRSGKDTTALHQIAKMAHQRKGLYWHMLPTQRQGRKVVWDAFSSDGTRLIDHVFPKEIRAKDPNSTEMKIDLACGSIVQIVGSDAYDSLVGSNPVGVVFSEWSLTDPRAWEFIRPILRENGGWAIFIFTPRGYNHGWDVKEVAERNDTWFCSVQTVRDTGVLTDEDIEEERRAGMQDELIRQEYFCDFSSANLGAILGSRLEQLERDGRIVDEDLYDPDGAGIELSLDIGFRDATACWDWQRRPDGFGILTHEEESGLDAQDWIDRISKRPYPISKIWLPHDAKARTFATKHSVLEQFMRAFPGKVKVLPVMRIADRVNAARTILPMCWINRSKCQNGVGALRAWSYAWDDVRKMFSKDPDHNWASHSGDSFSYGAVIMQKYVKPENVKSPAEKAAAYFESAQGAHHTFNLEELFKEHERRTGKTLRLQ